MALREFIIFEPPRPGAHPSGINGGLGASLIGVCDDGKATISSNDLLNILKAIIAVDPVSFVGGRHSRWICHYCGGRASFSADESMFKVVKHRGNCQWIAAKNYLADHA